MRRVAAYIYKKAGRWKQSIALSKKDNMYKDCMETASQSGDHDLAEQLLVYFIEQVCVSSTITSKASFLVKQKIKLTILFFLSRLFILTGEEGMLCHMSLCVL